MIMDCSTLVDELLTYKELTGLLATDPYKNKAIYQILSPEAEVFPRIALFEQEREYTRFADDEPIEEEVSFRIDIYARENVLYQINTELHKAMRDLGFRRAGQVQDDYLADLDIYVKSVTYSIKEQLPYPWEH